MSIIKTKEVERMHLGWIDFSKTERNKVLSKELSEAGRDLLLGVLIAKGKERKALYLLFGESVLHRVIEEEVVKLVWADQVFCNLLDLIVFIGRQEFRTDRSVPA